MRLVVVALVLCAAFAAAEEETDISKLTAGDPHKFIFPPGNGTLDAGWTLFKQCDARWANNRIGTCSKTICQVGCAMTSVAMINTWLTKNGGYAGGCNIYWAKADQYGKKTTFRSMQKANEKEICNGLAKGHGIIANVNNGGHWVLLTGCRGGGVFSVNDPGRNVATYRLSDISREAVYW